MILLFGLVSIHPEKCLVAHWQVAGGLFGGNLGMSPCGLSVCLSMVLDRLFGGNLEKSPCGLLVCLSVANRFAEPDCVWPGFRRHHPDLG